MHKIKKNCIIYTRGEKFLWAIGIKENLILKIKRCFETKTPIDEYILTQLNKQFKMFLIVGGMPRIVDEYVKEKSLGKVMSLQKSNLRLDCFKIYVRDTGLLMSMYEEGIQKDILNSKKILIYMLII